MNVLLLLMLIVAVFLYGSELLETTKNETSLSNGRMLLNSAPVGDATEGEKAAEPAPASPMEEGVSSASVASGEPEAPPVPAEALSKGPGLPLFAFHGDEPDWDIVNDTVMGGISRSMVEVDTERQRLTFSGDVSLDNNGGFASTRSEWTAYDLRMFDGIALRVRGDGHVYRFRLRTAETGSSIAYTALFPTEQGEWQEVYIPFASMVPLYRGFVVSDAGPLDPASIRSFGLMVADKQQGAFSLEVDWINAVVEKEADVKLISYTGDVEEDK